MRNKILDLFIYFTSAIISCIALVGIIIDAEIIKLVFILIFFVLTLYLILYTIGYTIEIIQYKKKMKNKRIRLRVVFVKITENTQTEFAQIFSATDDLSTCVQRALLFAKRNNCRVKSMNMLTTED